MKIPKVSIIIPVFNRGSLISQTLDSIRSQTYLNWECILVDDGSTDDTKKCISIYLQKDSRFFLFDRPKSKAKGANVCRNIGFQKSKGELIQFFDSDDMMLPEFLAAKVKHISNGGYDYVISKSEDFCHRKKQVVGNPSYYKFSEYELNHYNFALQKLSWITIDMLTKREVIEGLQFNEKLPSGQEYNFFCRLTALYGNGHFVDETLSLHRLHRDSIRGILREDKLKYQVDKTFVDFETWKDLEKIQNNYTLETISFFFNESVRNSLNIFVPFPFPYLIKLSREIARKKDYSTVVFYFLYQSIGRITGRGHCLRKKFLRKWNQ